MSNEHDAEGNRADTKIRKEAARDAEDEAMVARRTSPKQILFLLMLLLVILLIAVAAGRGVLIRFPGGGSSTNPIPTLSPIIGGQNGTQQQGASRPDLAGAQTNADNGAQANAGNPPPTCSPPGPTQQISARFLSYFNQYGGTQTFGRPISTEISNGGHVIQWFERARLEEWPELRGTRYMVQSGRIGAEFTQGIAFPKQTFFVSQPGLRYFAETGHGLRDPFLSFWLQNGGLDVFGYPISDEVNEQLEDGQIHLVQYFERVRFEYHPAAGQQVQIGLLGHALCLGNSRPKIVTPAQPTPVPLP
jgi:hypothetical protein